MPDVREKLVGLPVDDAILILKEEHKQRTDGYTTHLAYGGNGDPAEEVSLYALEMAIYALEQTKWIPVTERLPEDDLPKDSKVKRIKVLVAYRTNGNWIVRTQVRAKGYWYGEPDRWDWIKMSDPITHWMPLPEAPKGQ